MKIKNFVLFSFSKNKNIFSYKRIQSDSIFENSNNKNIKNIFSEEIEFVHKPKF